MNAEQIVDNVADIVERQTLLRPTAPALMLHDGVVSYRELATAVNTLADALLGAGVRAGQTIGVSMAQTPLHLFTLLALARIGAVSVPVHAMIPAQRRLLAARRYGVAAIVSGRAELRLEGMPFIHLGNVDIGKIVAPVPVYPATAGSPFRIALSSGTSGDPKGVLFSHGYMLDRIRKTNYACTPLSRILPMDLNFPIGFVFALGMLSVGGAVIFPPSNKPADLINTAGGCAATHWLLSPAQAEEIARVLTDERIHFPTLEHLRIVGSTPSRRLLDIIRKRFSPNVFVPYGSTEMGVISIASPEILQRYPDSSGRLCPWARAEVVDDSDQVLPAGHCGSLRLQAEGMVSGYHQAPGHSAERFRNGWYYPGDRARIDAEGQLFIEGREDEGINVNGVKINPHDIETVFQSHPSLQDAAALALPDASGSEVLTVAFISAVPVTIEELRTYAREMLGPLSPRQFVQMAAFPRNTNGKLLREQLSAQIGRQIKAAGGLH